MIAFEAARAAILATLEGFATGDPRIEALWLQGSLARGDADAFSDIDAYLAVRDQAFDTAWEGRQALLNQLGGVLAWSNAVVPGMTAVHALMEGGVRLDLFFERASTAPRTPRPVAKALVDKTGLVARFDLSWQASPDEVGRMVQTVIRMTRQGATWPLRVLGRGQWPALARMELDLINAQLAQLIAVRLDPANYYRNANALAMQLPQAERMRLAALTDRALAALAARDAVALKAVHLEVQNALVEEGRAACAALGVDYPIPEASERAVRDLIDRAWPP
ncbi:MAG TPA: nucleotidyltransferase domain-containing protein [Caulobacteraceae bacterium]|nr:nucleotidyltransferase domain-containing protein [Caulobacteraceae bacterium]